jgi:Ca2+-binding RTX toxin-like protein
LQSELRGSGGDDSLTGADDEFETGLDGGSGNDTLDGGTGGAFMSPGSGNDVIIGGTEDEGFYSVDYLWDAFDEGASSGITVVFSSERDGTITDFAGDTDSFTGIDRVQGTMFADSFTGTDGDQDFRGHGGNDFFDGGAGDGDRIDYSRPEAEFGTIGGVTVDMAAGTAIDAYGDTDTFINIERIRGTDFDDSMTGNAGNVRLEGRGGDDFLAAGSGGNDLHGGDGDDTLVSGAGGDALEGGSGGDLFVITAGGSFVYISDFEIGIDTLDLSGFARADALAAISGAQSGSAILTFGDGTVLTIEGNNVSPETLSLDDIELADEVIPSDQLINGDETPEALTGGSGNDTINGMGGDDTLTGLAGNDVMSGGDGADSLDGGDGNDSLQGDDGDDVLRGGAGDDTLEGGAGDDTLENVFGGTDVWDGGADLDTLVTDVSAISPDAGQVLSVDLAAGTHGLQGSTAGQDTLISIENFIILGAWAAEIRGDDSDNDLRGDAGNDTILGLAGNDLLSDGAGNDSVDGGAGDDTIVAGLGMDTFNGGDGYDLIEVDLSGTANGAFTAVIDLDNGEIYALEFPESNPDTLIGLEAIHLFADVDAKLFGNSEDNDLRSGQGDDALSGLGGDDSLDGQGGDDTIDGGDGIDTALYSGDQASYTLTLTPTGTTLTDRRADGNGTDMLTDIEFLDFDTDLFGAPFNLEEFGGPTGLSDTDFKSFIELYIAYFNRAPDAVGLNFWGTAFAKGTTLEEMAGLFEPQAETQAAYPPGTSNAEFATTVYNNVLGRVPDQDGLNFWVGVLDGGSVGRDTFILEVLRGVKAAPPEGASQEFIDQQMADAEYLANKTDIGAYFAVIKGMSDTDDASAAMAFFDGSESSISSAVTAIDGFYADALDPVDGGFLMPLVGVLDDPFATV